MEMTDRERADVYAREGAFRYLQGVLNNTETFDPGKASIARFIVKHTDFSSEDSSNFGAAMGVLNNLTGGADDPEN